MALGLRRAARRSREAIERVQRARLQALVRHARANSKYYREKFAAIDEAKFGLTDLPTTTKSDMMDNFDDAVTAADVCRHDVETFLQDETHLGKLFHDKYVLSHTSGSQGQPLLIVQPKENLELLFALQARGNEKRLTIGQVLRRLRSPVRLAAVTLKQGFYPSAIAFEYMPEGARRFIEPLRIFLGDEDMVPRLQQFRPTHLTAYASVLHELARHIEGGRLTLKPELEQVVNISERLMPKARKHYEKVFGAPVLDDYAMGECLFLSNGCRTGGGMHVNADWAILEVVDEQNRPVPDGKKGSKALVTNLANDVQPFIRYEVGDIVTMSDEPCACGIHLPLIARVEGRDSDMFWVRTNEGRQPLPPAVFDLALAQVFDAREYQVIQEDNRRVRVLIEPLPDVNFDRRRASHEIREELEKYGLAQAIDVELQVVDRLVPDRGGKFKRFVSKVAKGK
jgi:phenylacetate-coenzyme A ligase PaaK-like adenylate-forming protein